MRVWWWSSSYSDSIRQSTMWWYSSPSSTMPLRRGAFPSGRPMIDSIRANPSSKIIGVQRYHDSACQ